MVFNNLCITVLWAKVASALEGLSCMGSLMFSLHTYTALIWQARVGTLTLSPTNFTSKNRHQDACWDKFCLFLHWMKVTSEMEGLKCGVLPKITSPPLLLCVLELGGLLLWLTGAVCNTAYFKAYPPRDNNMVGQTSPRRPLAGGSRRTGTWAAIALAWFSGCVRYNTPTTIYCKSGIKCIIIFCVFF